MFNWRACSALNAFVQRTLLTVSQKCEKASMCLQDNRHQWLLNATLSLNFPLFPPFSTSPFRAQAAGLPLLHILLQVHDVILHIMSCPCIPNSQRWNTRPSCIIPRVDLISRWEENPVIKLWHVVYWHCAKKCASIQFSSMYFILTSINTSWTSCHIHLISILFCLLLFYSILFHLLFVFVTLKEKQKQWITTPVHYRVHTVYISTLYNLWMYISPSGNLNFKHKQDT